VLVILRIRHQQAEPSDVVYDAGRKRGIPEQTTRFRNRLSQYCSGDHVLPAAAQLFGLKRLLGVKADSMSYDNLARQIDAEKSYGLLDVADWSGQPEFDGVDALEHPRRESGIGPDGLAMLFPI
jgi:hypothetical protein